MKIDLNRITFKSGISIQNQAALIPIYQAWEQGATLKQLCETFKRPLFSIVAILLKEYLAEDIHAKMPPEDDPLYLEFLKVVNNKKSLYSKRKKIQERKRQREEDEYEARLERERIRLEAKEARERKRAELDAQWQAKIKAQFY